MNNSLKFSSFISFIAILVVLLTSGSTQEAHSQFGLFDTVWTTKNFKITGSGHTTISNNDSLIFLFKEPAYGVDNDTSQKYILFRTMDLNDTLRYISNFPTQNEPLSFIENDSKILFESRTITPERKEINPCILTRNCENFQITDSVAFDYKTFPPNTEDCYKFYCSTSEVDTSIYYWGYCGATAIKGISYKVNYRTGQTTITSDSLQYFAMTISEDGQYVAGVYYTGGGGTNVPYNEVIEVRKIRDYSVIFREESKYSDWTPNFTPYQWVTGYKFKFSKDKKFLALNYGYNGITVYNLENHQKIFTLVESMGECTFSKNNKIFFYKISFENKRIICIYNCLTGVVQEMEFEDNKWVAGDKPTLIFNDEYILFGYTNYFDINYGTYKKLGETTFLKLNFDINSIQEPDNHIHGTLYPNPTNNSITLIFDLKTPIQLNYSIYSETGQLIKLLLDEFTYPGLITKSFNVSGLPTGTYFLRITGERFSQTYKVIINR